MIGTALSGEHAGRGLSCSRIFKAFRRLQNIQDRGNNKHGAFHRRNDNVRLARYRLIADKRGADRIGRGPKVRRPDRDNLREAGLLHQPQLIPNGDRTTDSLRPGFGAVLHIGRQVMFQ